MIDSLADATELSALGLADAAGERFARNMSRGDRAAHLLRALGWRVFTVWECDLKPARRAEAIDALAEAVCRGAGLGATVSIECGEGTQPPTRSERSPSVL